MHGLGEGDEEGICNRDFRSGFLIQILGHDVLDFWTFDLDFFVEIQIIL